jgi:penicillin-binding protein 2
MFVFDIFREDGGRVRAVTAVMALGLFLLLGGLWFVQIVCAQHFESDLKKQSFRHVRTPAMRGKILDRDGRVLAYDQPRYNAVLYLEDLQSEFTNQYARLKKDYVLAHPEVVNPKGKITLPKNLGQQLRWQADCDVVSNYTYGVSFSLREPRLLNAGAFLRHYTNYPYVPFQIIPDLKPEQVAVLSERWLGQSAVDLETQPVRSYPNGSLAANLLGYVKRRDASGGGKFLFDMPDYEGESGVEYVYDGQLCGQPGDTSVLINNMNYRQREQIEAPNQPGNDVYLTIDLSLQKAAEKALAEAQASVRGAVLVMNPRNGDILVMASAPTFDPNMFSREHLTPEESARLKDPKFTPELNRAVMGAYPPGSTFKIITGLACLESGLDPNEVFDSPGIYIPPKGRPIEDTAAAGPYTFERAFYRSSNTYFIMKGKDRLRKILEMAKRFHLGEKTGLAPRQEVAGNVPGPEMVGPSLGMSAPDICIGQEITTTLVQMAGMISVIANGGTLYWPRVVSHARSPATGETEELAALGRVRDHVQLNPDHLAIIRKAMLADTQQAADSFGKGGTAYPEFHTNQAAIRLAGFRVAGKTGTAQIKSPGSQFKHVTWFDSYGPYEDPRYVVIVMVEDGGSGGGTCAPVAEKIYEAIVKQEQERQGRPATMARN